MGHQTDELLERTDAAFQTTHWTAVEGLRAGDESVRREAAARVVDMYWPPVYAAARRLVRTREDAADLTQGFFADVVLGRGLLKSADPARGSLRSLVRSALKRYATDQWRRTRSRGEGRGLPLFELDREDALCVDDSPEGAFDRRWALALLEEALRRCEAHFRAPGSGRVKHWELFEARVLVPAVHGCERRPLAEQALEMGFGSGAAGAAAVQTVKRRLDALFREAVAETLSDPADLSEEYAIVQDLLSRP